MRTSCAMMSLRVTLPIEEEGADVDEAVETRGIVVPDRLEHSYTSLHLTIAMSMAHMTWK